MRVDINTKTSKKQYGTLAILSMKMCCFFWVRVFRMWCVVSCRCLCLRNVQYVQSLLNNLDSCFFTSLELWLCSCGIQLVAFHTKHASVHIKKMKIHNNIKLRISKFVFHEDFGAKQVQKLTLQTIGFQMRATTLKIGIYSSRTNIFHLSHFQSSRFSHEVWEGWNLNA